MGNSPFLPRATCPECLCLIRVLVWRLGPLGPGRLQPVWHPRITKSRQNMTQVHTHGNLPFDCFAGITVRSQG